MKSQLRTWLAVLLAGLCLTTLTAQAAPEAGRDYRVIDPAQSTDDPGRIEVVEVFSYACPHCNDLNPLIHKWAAKLPRDVYFKRIPANFNPFYGLMARLFYTLDTIGDLDRLDAEAFSAIHQKGLKLVSEKAIADWAVSQGVDAQRFSEAWNSFSVASKVKRADEAARKYGIQGVPAIIVDGRYQVGGKSFEEMLKLTDQVIDMRRAERSGKAAGAAKK